MTLEMLTEEKKSGDGSSKLQESDCGLSKRLVPPRVTWALSCIYGFYLMEKCCHVYLNL